jgi:hypothetical protein
MAWRPRSSLVTLCATPSTMRCRTSGFGVAQALDGLPGLVAAVRQQRLGNGLGERQFGPAEQFA